MVETPTLIPSQPVHKSTATLALVLGIVGLFIPFIGAGLGIAAIILGAIALRKKTTNVAPAIIGIVTGAAAILVTVLAALLISFFSTHSPLFPPSDRDKAVTAMINAKSSFTVGETAVIGSKDVKIINVERNHVLTADEQKPASSNPDEATSEEGLGYYQDNGESIPEVDAEYVVVKLQVTENQNVSLEDGGLNLDNWRLNKVKPYSQLSDPTNSDTEYTYLYRIRKSADKLLLKGSITIFTSVSPIVGTEGAPRKVLIYSIALN